MSIGDGFSHRMGRNGEFCVEVGPGLLAYYFNAPAVNLSRPSGWRGLYASWIRSNSRRLKTLQRGWAPSLRTLLSIQFTLIFKNQSWQNATDKVSWLHSWKWIHIFKEISIRKVSVATPNGERAMMIVSIRHSSFSSSSVNKTVDKKTRRAKSDQRERTTVESSKS